MHSEIDLSEIFLKKYIKNFSHFKGVERKNLGTVPIMRVSAERRGSTKQRKTTQKPYDPMSQPSSDAEKIENIIAVRSKFLESWIYELQDFPKE